MKEPRFPLVYFLLYPVLGPLLSYLGMMGVVLAGNRLNDGFVPDLTLGSMDWADLFSLLPVAYILGIVQAIFTGRYAAASLRKYGKSALVENLLVSFAASAGILVLAGFAFGFGVLQLGVVLVPAGFFAVLVLRGVEKLFHPSRKGAAAHE